MNRRRFVLTSLILIAFSLTGCAWQKKVTKLEPELEIVGLRISKVSVDPKTLDFSQNKPVLINFSLSKEANVTMEILDRAYNSIEQLLQDKKLPKGEHTVQWEGKNMEGQSVPNGVYFYTIKAVSHDGSFIYDPYKKTYGVRLDIDKVDYDKEKNEINFVLPKAAMVRLRTGLKEGALLNTVFDWQAKEAGKKSFSWNGKDVSGYIDIKNHPNLMIYVSAYTLGDNSIIVKNSPLSVISAVLPRMANEKYIHAFHMTEQCHEPKFSVEFLKETRVNNKDYPVLSGRVPIRVTIDESDRAQFIAERFEIVIFVDTIFLFEDEDASTPFNYYWDTRGLNKGEHVLTINIIGFQDHIGAQSLKVEVE